MSVNRVSITFSTPDGMVGSALSGILSQLKKKAKGISLTLDDCCKNLSNACDISHSEIPLENFILLSADIKLALNEIAINLNEVENMAKEYYEIKKNVSK